MVDAFRRIIREEGVMALWGGNVIWAKCESETARAPRLRYHGFFLWRNHRTYRCKRDATDKIETMLLPSHANRLFPLLRTRVSLRVTQVIDCIRCAGMSGGERFLSSCAAELSRAERGAPYGPALEVLQCSPS